MEHSDKIVFMKCSKLNCDNNPTRRGMCDKHYKRWYRDTPKNVRGDGRRANRKAILNDTFALIPLNRQGKYAVVDTKDAWVDKHAWHLSNKGYPCSRINNKIVLLHILLVGRAPEGYVNDHINRNKLDNRRKNLRVVTIQENNLNSNLSKNNKSGHNGVSWYKPYNKWVAYAHKDYKRHTIGYYKDLEEAVKARESFILTNLR